jgi:hypothetical protein
MKVYLDFAIAIFAPLALGLVAAFSDSFFSPLAIGVLAWGLATAMLSTAIWQRSQ